MIKIRLANKKDIPEVYKLGKILSELSFSNKFPFHERTELKEFVKNRKENIFLVAEDNKKVIGFVFAKILAHGSGGWCMLDNLAVDNKFRNHGVGSLLLNEIYRVIKERKIYYVQILEEIHHKRTRKFWRDKGFKEERVFIWADKFLRQK